MDVQTVQDQDETLEHLETTEVAESPPSIRDSLASALEQSKAKQAEEPKEKVAKSDAKVSKTGRERDEAGKFATKSDKPEKAPVTTEQKIEDIPHGVSAEIKAKWATYPPEVRQEFSKREQEYHKELTKQDEVRALGKQLRDLATPYLPVIKAEGGDLPKAFSSFLNTAYILRTKTPQEKGRLLMQLAQEFGADLRGASQAQAPSDPRFDHLMQELQTVKSTLQQEQEFKKQQEETALQSQITAFAADPKHVHFEAVKAPMAALLRGGIAVDLQDAYDRAVYADPHIRSTLLSQQQAESDEKRVAEKKAKAEQARRAGSSLRGAPGMAATKNGRIVQPDLRSELRAAFASHQGG